MAVDARPSILLLLSLASLPALASSLDNESGSYVLTALPDAEREAQRMDRSQLNDQQPAGRHVRRGEQVQLFVTDLPAGFELRAWVGFRPMWNVEQNQQEVPLDEGENSFTADQDGPLFFQFTAPPGKERNAAEVQIEVEGGKPLPLYVDGEMDADDWQAELESHARAPFVQLFGEYAMITLPARDHARHPIDDPQATFEAIHEVLELQDKLAGFDGKTRRDRRSPLRQHYLVDFRASAADRQNWYMYATDQFIGMQSGNFTELTDPDTLRSEWAIWHETGHTHQQNSWTWESIGEINVNLFSLYVQEHFGLPSRLEESEDGAPTTLERARDYLEAGADDYLTEGTDDDYFFIRLVMFHQLKEAFGWELFTELHKHFRAHPQPEDNSDQDKADAFVKAVCELTGEDLRPFFERWGLRISDEASLVIDDHGYPEPDEDYSAVF